MIEITLKASYFSTYLIKAAAEILPKEKGHILIILEDFFNQMKQPSIFTCKFK